jgi:hypothetical protein
MPPTLRIRCSGQSRTWSANEEGHAEIFSPEIERVRTPEELKIKNTLSSIQKEQKEAGGCHDSDTAIRKLLKEKIPLTQKNYLELCYFGAKSSVEDLSFEEAADLPDSFFAWPVDEHSVN